jgi:hypothetical protein
VRPSRNKPEEYDMLLNSVNTRQENLMRSHDYVYEGGVHFAAAVDEFAAETGAVDCTFGGGGTG